MEAKTKTTITFTDEESMILHKACSVFFNLLRIMDECSADNLYTVTVDPYTTEDLERTHNMLHYLAHFGEEFEVD